MKIPKTKKTYCPSCRKHTEFKVYQTKTGANRGSLKKGSIKRAKKRGRGVGFGNLGKWGSKPAVSKWKRAGAKTSKKLILKLSCKICSKSRLLKLKRARKVSTQ
jgi:large subunit ribosomal protein L44e